MTEISIHTWNTVTLLESKMIAEGVTSLVFDAPWWKGHRAGQYIDVRLTALSGYQAQRSYSIANAPEDIGKIEISVQLLSSGEVSPFLFNLKGGDQIEMRGPLGGHFIWSAEMPGPLVLIGGGSGVVPLMSMLRHLERAVEKDMGRESFLLISSKTIDRVLYRDELEKFTKTDPNFTLTLALTESAPIGWSGYTRRVDKEMFRELFATLLDKMPMFYVCGSTPFVETSSNLLVQIGFNPHEIKTERFGG